MTTVAWVLGDWSPWLLFHTSMCVLGAVVVRGYSGFGFSLLSIPSLSLAFPPATIVPTIFLLAALVLYEWLRGPRRDVEIEQVVEIAGEGPLGWRFVEYSPFNPR